MANWNDYEEVKNLDWGEFEEVQPTKKGIDITPSGLAKKAGVAISTPIRQVLYKESPEVARAKATEQIEAPFSGRPLSKGQGVSNLINTTAFAADVSPYFAMPQLNTVKGAGLGAKIVNSGLTGAYQGGIAGGLESLKQQGDLSGIGSGALAGGAAGSSLTIGWEKIKTPIKKVLNNPQFKEKIANAIEAITSVPSEYTQRALDKELLGQTIFKGKFNPKTAYQGIEKKLVEAKGKLPSKEYYKGQYKKLGDEVRKKLNANLKDESYFDEKYNELGQKALNSIDELNTKAGNQVQKALSELPENTTFSAEELMKDVDNIYGQYSLSNNPKLNVANNQAGKEYKQIKKLVEGEQPKVNIEAEIQPQLMPATQITPKELYDINRNVSAMTQWNNPNAGISNDILEQVYGSYANRLNNLSPELAEANNLYSKIMNLEKATGGLNPSTIGSKLRDYGSGNQLRSGVSKSFEDINNLLPQEQRFLKEAIELNNQRNAQNLLKQEVGESVLNDISRYDNLPYSTQDAVRNIAPDEVSLYQRLANQQKEQNEIMKAISSKAYERNPRLLANRNDIAGEQALEYLQNQSGINFMDDLNDIRAREALEKLMPGQGGGSGSEQGFFNNYVRPVALSIPKSGTAAIIGNSFGGPVGTGIGLFSVSPKFMGKGTIQNIGRLNRLTNQEVPQGVQRLLPSQAAKIPVLYGQVEYNEGY
jgi:hypothetical protein